MKVKLSINVNDPEQRNKLNDINIGDRNQTFYIDEKKGQCTRDTQNTCSIGCTCDV